MKIILVGAGGSGKDYARTKLQKRNLKYSISYTTRPARENEADGVDYHFIDKDTFEYMILSDQLLEYDEFNGWYYGSSKQAWIDYDLYILTPPGIRKLSEEQRNQAFIIYLDIPEEVRRERLSKRRDADSVERRIQADKEMFDTFTDFDIRIKNTDF